MFSIFISNKSSKIFAIFMSSEHVHTFNIFISAKGRNIDFAHLAYDADLPRLSDPFRGLIRWLGFN